MDRRPVHWKPETLLKGFWRHKETEKIFYVMDCKKLTLLKCPSYLKQSTDLMQSLSKSQWHHHRNKTKSPKICMEPQKNPEVPKKNLERKKGWRNHTPWFQIIVQSYSTQNSKAEAEKQAHKSIEQNWELRNKPTFIYTTKSPQRHQECTIKKQKVSSVNGVGKTGQSNTKEWN